MRRAAIAGWIALALCAVIGAFIVGQATGSSQGSSGPGSGGSGSGGSGSEGSRSAVAPMTAPAFSSGSSSSTTSSVITGGPSVSTSGPALMPGLRGENLASVASWARRFKIEYTTFDDSGRGRTIILDGDWQVCHTIPAEGAALPTGTKARFGVVKNDETCPVVTRPLERPSAAPGTMPEVVGMVLSQVNAFLTGHGASTSVKDLLRGRPVLVESNWQICTQSIPAGSALPNGSYVRLGVVKYGESCP